LRDPAGSAQPVARRRPRPGRCPARRTAGRRRRARHRRRHPMTRNQTLSLAVAAVLVALAAGWMLGRAGHDQAASLATGDAASSERRILYYRNPMGLPDTSPVPKKDPMGMDYIPVYAGGAPADDAG